MAIPSDRARVSLLFSLVLLTLTSCGHSDNNNSVDVPQTPLGVGFAETAPAPDEATTPPYVDFAYTNQRGDARYVTKETNAGVRVLAGFLDLWTPSTLLVDAGAAAPASGNFPAVVASNWSGIPGDATDGKIVNAAVLTANIQYVIDATAKRTADQALAAYVDDRRGKGYSVSDGMGPLTEAWRAAARQTTTIAGIPADATTVRYDDLGNNLGVGGTANTTFGTVVDFIGSVSNNGSTEPAKRYYKYARPWRWSSKVVVVPALEPAKSTTPNTDGGFTSGHAAEATRDAVGMAYVMPERYQEMVSRGLELGENRILAGMHSPLDVISGRIQAQAVVAANLVASTAAARKAAYDQAHSAMMAAAGTTSLQAFNDYAHSGAAADRFSDYAANKANYLRRMTYGLNPIGDTTKPAVVPKGAELLLETRLPYLDATQRRVVLKTTALPSGYPIMDDAEGWGRLNLFAAADGYGAFNGDVSVNMDAAQGGFAARDTWRNDITGKGKLSKSGSGTLRLAGNSSYSGGTQIDAGTLESGSPKSFGAGDVYVSAGTLVCDSAGGTSIAGRYTQLAGGTLQLNIGAGDQGKLFVGGGATFNGALNIKFAGRYRPAVGDVLNVISAGTRNGTFSSVNVDGFKATASYTGTGVQIRIDG